MQAGCSVDIIVCDTFMRSGHPVSLCTGILDPVVIVDEESLLLLKKVIYLLKAKEKSFKETKLLHMNMYFIF